VSGAGENFNILEYTDSEVDSSAAEHHDKSLGDAVHASVSMQDPASSSSSSSIEFSSVASSSVTGSCASVTSSTSGSVHVTFPETASGSASLMSTSSKPFSTGETSATKGSVAAEESMKSDSGRTSESCTKSVPSSGFMTTDFQAKFLEFSQRKAACITVGQTAPIDDPDCAVSASGVKMKKADVLVAPPTVKKSSPVADDSAESVEVKCSGGECHSSGGDSQPEGPATSLPMQVDGCCDDCSDDGAEESQVLSDVDMTVPRWNYSVDNDRVDFLNVDEPELVEIWLSSIGLQVDGAADDETESQEKSTSNCEGQMTADNQHQSPDGLEADAVVDTGVNATLASAEETTPSCSSAVPASSCTVSDSATFTSASKPVPVDVQVPSDTAQQLHPSTSVSSDANLSAIKDSEAVMTAHQLSPTSVHMASTSEPLTTIFKMSNLPVETTALVHCSQSDTSQSSEHVYSVAVIPTNPFISTSSLVSELQSSSACGDVFSTAAAYSASLQLESASTGTDVTPCTQVMNQAVINTEASTSSVLSAVVSSECHTVMTTSTSSCEMTGVDAQSGVSSQCLVEAFAVGVDSSTVSTSSQVVVSHSVAASAVPVDPACHLSAPMTGPVVTGMPVASQTGHADTGSGVAVTNQTLNGGFQLRPEMQQPFMGHPPRRMYLPPEFHMQHRMMQRGMPAGEGMMIPAEQLPQGPPPPYPNKQFAGPQTFWVRQQHPSSVMQPEWIRHPGDFGQRPLPPNLGSHEWSRPQMMPAEWPVRQRMQQEWVYFPQQPHHPSQAPNQWVRPPYSNMLGFQPGVVDAAATMQTDSYNPGYPPASRNISAQDTQVAQGIKSPGSGTARPSSHPSGSPVPASPASARADMTSPQSRSHTPRSMSRSSTPQAPLSGTSGMSRTPDHVTFPAGSPHPAVTVPSTTVPVVAISNLVEQSSVPLSGHQPVDHVDQLSSETPRPASVSAADTGISQAAVVSAMHAANPAVPLSSAQLTAFSHAPGENMMYMHRPPHAMPVSPEMRRMGPPTGGRYMAPPQPQGMYVPGHPAVGTSSMTFYRVPSSAASTHSAIGALLNQQRPPVGMPVHYPSVTQAPGGPVMEPCYQLIHTQEAYLPHSQRQVYSSAVTVAGPSVSASGTFVLQHQQRGLAPPLAVESAGHQEVPNQTSGLPNSMQTAPMLRGSFRMPQQLGPGSMPMGMRVAGPAAPVVYGPQRPVPPTQVRMIAAGEMRPQMIHIPRSSVTEFTGPSYRPRPPGEQPLLLEDLLEQVRFKRQLSVENIT